MYININSCSYKFIYTIVHIALNQKGHQMFNYDKAFSRNIGWVTEEEQQALRGKKVAIAGAGGVGGVHLLTLARLGSR